ncbi:SbcC/MukB-like Walker B domain-containing protein [Verrucomicrobium spinosum]|uniref:SbcC/MukB-like Walker B domain-containing protein n=2 Tax=Verrucomicrobium spinosum TaxID=2736 RepID=UPI000174504C|nr:SbcC/MukB-like Walker B domain-containing protein [Verrucomicrobium spinosum]
MPAASGAPALDDPDFSGAALPGTSAHHSRAIRLTRIHALNWYGYQDSLAVKGNLVLAGLTGSGKSILMDLVMLVLVGPEKARHHFNRSATGTQSDRTLKGYCLLDTKREENGQPTYYRDKGATTYVALEFTWPGGQRIETWGLRIEFRNASENDGQITPFFCKGSLERADFLTAWLDGKKRPSELPAFRALIDARAGRTFASSREYLRDMSNPEHLNFNREVLDRLLPSAMSFTNLKSFDDFCRRFVLPGESVPVEDVTASYRDFQSYEQELKSLRAQLERLQRIRDLSQKLESSIRDRDVARYLHGELSHEHAKQLVESGEKRLADLKVAHAAEQAQLDELDRQIQQATAERERLLAVLNETSEGRLYGQLSAQVKELEGRVESLSSLQARVEDRLRRRVDNAREWLEKMRAASIVAPLDGRAMEKAIRTLDDCEAHATFNALSAVRAAAEQLCQDLRRSVSNETQKLQSLRRHEEELSQQLTALRSGLPPIPQPLLHTLNERLPRLPGEPTARALRDLCEVTDERWREALEVAFTDKFSIVVPEQHYEDALKIYHELKPASQSVLAAAESLIHPRRALALSREVLPGSLAEKIETDDAVARAILDHLFGGMICVETLAELEKHSAAILPDGLTLRDAQARRARHYDGLPFIGQRGLQRQRDIKASQLKEVEAQIRRLEPIERAVQESINLLPQMIPDHNSMVQDLSKLETLPEMESNLEKARRTLADLDTSAYASIAEQAEEWQPRIRAWNSEKLDIVGKGSHREIEQTEKMLDKRRQELNESLEAFTRTKMQVDISLHLERLRTWREEMRNRYMVSDVMAREFEKARAAASEEAIRSEGDLKQAMTDFKKTFQPKFDDLPEDGRTAAPYERVLARIEGASIIEYEKKAQSEKARWETLFRTQVLSRMQRALKRVEDIIFLLNKQLKRPIGRDLYKIRREPNPDFKFYRELIDLNALHQEDGLFYNSIGGELRQALDSFLNTLVHHANTPEAARLLDYRQYYDYKLQITDIHNPDAPPIDVDKQGRKMSGGENQSPYFVAILASYLHAYNRHETRWKEPSLALVPIDEAFSKLSGERIQDCIGAIGELDLQGVFSMSSGNIPYAFSLCDELIVITKREERSGNRSGIRNVPSVLFSDTPEGKEWMEKHKA